MTIHFAVPCTAAAVACTWALMSRTAFACGGECAVGGGGTGVITLLAIVAGAWALILAGGYVRQRVIARRHQALSE